MYSPLMTLAEVAQYLRLTENEIIALAQKNELPAGKIGNDWRFRRSDIERWVAAKFTTEVAPTIISLKEILTPACVIFLESAKKDDALRQLCAVLAQTPQINNREELESEIFRRETMMSTGIGLGVGVPHVRLASITNIILAVGISRQPILDYKNYLDGLPVHIICMIAAHHDQQSQYLKLLSGIAALLREEKTRERILAATDTETIYNLMTA